MVKCNKVIYWPCESLGCELKRGCHRLLGDKTVLCLRLDGAFYKYTIDNVRLHNEFEFLFYSKGSQFLITNHLARKIYTCIHESILSSIEFYFVLTLIRQDNVCRMMQQFWFAFYLRIYKKIYEFFFSKNKKNALRGEQFDDLFRPVQSRQLYMHTHTVTIYWGMFQCNARSCR